MKPQFKFTKDDLVRKVLQAYGVLPGGKVGTSPKPNLLQLMETQRRLGSIRKRK